MFKKPEYGATTTVNTMLMSIVLIVSIMHTSTFARSHPFIFFTSEDIPALQAKVSQSGSRSKKAYDLFFTGTPTLDLQKMGGLKHEVFYQKQLLQVALKYTITGDTKYADRAISGIDRAMEMYNPDTFNWEDTGWAKGISDAQRKMVGSWLWGWGFGEVTRAVAVTYDIVYDQMTAAKRAQVLDWLERVCHHFKNNVNDGGRRDVLHNHTIPPYAAMAFTCWIIRDDTTDDMIKNQYPSYANDFVRRWYDKMYFQPNGNFTESALYTYFGADTCFSYSAALHINNEPDILSGTSAYNVLKFIGHGTMAYQEEDGFPILPGFGDNHERYNMTRYSCALVPILISQDAVQLFYYKHSIDDLNNTQSIANLTENNSIVNNNSLVNTVLFYPESLSERHPHDAGVSDGQLFLDRSGIGGSAALRSGWDLAGTGKDMVTAWFVNRYNRVNHNHHDMNAFELAAYGEYFLIDPLHELYSSPRHGTSLGHNHIIIDDIGLPSSAARTGGCHADCSILGEIHGFTSGDGGTVLRGDARYSYIDRLPIAEALDRKNIGQVTREDIDNHGGPLDKAERVFGLINGGNNPPYAIIIDEIKQDDATHKYNFRLHTYKSLSGLGTPADPFIADGTDADLHVTLVQPEAFTGSTGEYGERPSSAGVENNNMIDAVQHEITGHFFAILYPRKNGMPNAAISSSAVENGVGAVVSWGSTGSDILLEKRSGSLVSYCNAVSGGRFASVRIQSGSVVSYLLLEGETLSYNGTTLISISGGGSASASVNGTIASVDAPGTSGFSVYAPAATTMLLNGSKISITHNGDYIVFGDGGPNPPAPPRPPYPSSPVVREMKLDWSTHKRFAQGSDNFQLTWADDNHLYGAWGDGGGFGGTNEDGRVSLGVARVEGPWNNYRRYNVWGGKHAENPVQFKGKSWGMICIKGVLYMWVVPDYSEDGAKKIWHYTEARLAKSTEHGAHWTKANWAFFESKKLIIPTICNFGKNYAGARDNYVYHYFICPQDNMPPCDRKRVAESLIVHKPGRIYLARVHKDEIFDGRDNYEFFIRLDKNGLPKWGNISAKQPVFEDKNGTGWCMSASFHPGIGRYILCTEHTESSKGNLGVFDAPEPWGPWTTVEYIDSWGKGHVELNTFFWNFPTKWLSEDGREFTLVFTGAGRGLNNDSFNAVRGRFILKDVPQVIRP